MTAISLIVQRDGAHLLTDAAYYFLDGKVCEIRSKVARLDRIDLAVAVSGSITVERVVAALQDAPDQAAALARLPDAIARFTAENAIRQPDYEGHPAEPNSVQIFLAAWSRRRGRAEGFITSSNRAWFGPSYEPRSVVSIDQAISPPIAAGGVDLRRFKPRLHGKALMMEQRRYLGSGHPSVGGWGEVTSVGPNGIRQARLIDWPEDRVGKRISTD